MCPRKECPFNGDYEMVKDLLTQAVYIRAWCDPELCTIGEDKVESVS